MPASLAPIDSRTLAALRAGEEPALGELFLERYPVLYDEAFGALPEPVPASRVVERAFLRVWNERTTLDSPGRFEAALKEGMHDAVVRERSRRAAAHRLAEHEGAHARAPRAPAQPPTAQEAWQHLAGLLHPSAADESVARERADRSRHEAAAHIVEVERQPSRVPLIIGVVVGALAVLGLVFALDNMEPESSLTRALAAPEARPYTSGRGQRARIGVEGVDALVLGADSRLVVPPRFESMRGVGLEGTVDVDLAPGERLIVQTPAGRVTGDDGARFAVSARAGEPLVARADSGSVTVSAGGVSRQLQPGEAVTVGADGTIAAAAPAQVEETLAWTSDSLVFAQRPLREVLPELARWYGLDLWLADSALLDRPVTMRAGLGSSRDALDALERGAGVQVQNRNRRLYLVDAPASVPARRAARGPAA